MSATPVREAMLRLVGEALLDMPVTGGFEIPSLDENAARHLYILSQYVMLTAASCRSSLLVSHDFNQQDELGAPPPIELLFDSISQVRSEEHTSELQSLMRISYAVFCLKKKTTHIYNKI